MRRIVLASVSAVALALPVLARAQTIAYPTGIPSGGAVLQNPTTGPLAARMVTWGAGFAQGAMPAGSTLAATVAGAATAVQLDVHSTWPDGSARWASVTLMQPALAAGASVPVALTRASATTIQTNDNATGTQTTGLATTGGSTSYLTPARGIAVQEDQFWTGDSASTLTARFNAFKALGITDIKVIASWSQVEDTYTGEASFTPVPVIGYIQAACAAGLRIRLGVDTISGEPYSFFTNNANSQLVDANGNTDQYLQASYWLPGYEAAVHKVTDYIIGQVASASGTNCIDEIGPSYGTAGENLYPSSGYLSFTPSFWAYDANAKADFAAKMQAKYGTIAAANQAWGTTFSSFPTAPYPAGTPGAAYTPTSAMWTDFLYWYRNEKRAFAQWQVQDTLETIKKYYPTNSPAFSVPIAGLHLTPAQFNASVANQGATDAAQDDSIISYIDTEFLVDLAHQNSQYGIALHMTSLPNDPEGSYVKAYEKATYGAYQPMTGENNGHDDRPVEMANNAQAFNLLQTDIVDASDIISSSDHMTPSNPNYTNFQNAFTTLAHQFAGTTPYKQTYTQTDYAFILQAGTCLPVDPASTVAACLSQQGQFQIVKNGSAIWTSSMNPATVSCATGVPYNQTCNVEFNGQLFEEGSAQNQIWNSGNTNPDNNAELVFTTTAPYMQIVDATNGTVLWTTGVTQ